MSLDEKGILQGSFFNSDNKKRLHNASEVKVGLGCSEHLLCGFIYPYYTLKKNHLIPIDECTSPSKATAHHSIVLFIVIPPLIFDIKSIIIFNNNLNRTVNLTLNRTGDSTNNTRCSLNVNKNLNHITNVYYTKH